MNNINKQLPLNFKPNTYYKRDDFMVSSCNSEAINVIDNWPNWSFFAFVLYGPEGCGKSHLAHVFAEKVALTCEKPISVKIINAKEITNNKVDRLHKENPCLVVENLNPKADNEALFHLFNLYQNEGGYILFTALNAPARMNFKLPDLQSRLNMIPSIAIKEPDDTMLTMLIVKLFNDRQIMISQEVLNYIDVLVDGQYNCDLYSPRLKWKGSSNQRVIDVQKSLELGNVVLYDEELVTS